MSGLVGPPSRSMQRQAARGPVRRTARHAVGVALLITGGLVVALTTRAPDPGLGERLYAAAMAALVLVVLVRAVSALSAGGTGETFDELVDPGSDAADGRLLGVASLEQSVRFGSSSAGDFHTRLRPVLADIARHRLSDRGVQLDSAAQQERVEAILGSVAYELVKPGVPPPYERFAPGVPRSVLESVSATLRDL